MADDDTVAGPDEWEVCAPLVRVKIMTHDGMQWRDFGDGAPLPPDVDAAHREVLARRGLIKRRGDTQVPGWPGTPGNPAADPQEAQRRVIAAMDKAGEVKVERARAVRRARRGARAAETPLSAAVGGGASSPPLSAAVSGAPVDDEHGDSGDGSNSSAGDE